MRGPNGGHLVLLFAVAACGGKSTSSHPGSAGTSAAAAGTTAGGSGGTSASAGGSGTGSGGTTEIADAGASGTSGTTASNEGWVRQLGTTTDDKAISVAADANANVFVLVSSRLDDPALPDAGSVVAKLDRSGTLVWTTSAPHEPQALAASASGNAIVIAGRIATDDDRHPINDVVVTCLDSNGEERWSTRFGSDGFDSPLAVTVGEDEHTFVLWSSGEPLGYSHNVLVELDASGGTVAATPIGGVEPTFGAALDRHGNVLLVTRTHTYTVSKYDSPGSLLWRTDVPDSPAAITGDDEDNTCVLGLPHSTSARSLTRLDPAGELAYSTELGDSRELSSLVACDGARGTFLAGATYATSTTNPDVLMLRLDANGAEASRWTLASDEADQPLAIAVDPTGALLVAGLTAGTLPEQTSFGALDAFVARIVP